VPPDNKEPWWKRLVHKVYENREEPHYSFKKRGALGYYDVTDPQIAGEVLRRDMDFPIPSFLKKGLARFIGPHALALDEGAPWKNRHALLADIFSPKRITENIAPLILQESDAMIDRWLAEKKTVDAEQEMRRLAARVVMRMIFSDDISDRESADIIEAATVSLESFRTPKLLTKLVRISGVDKLLRKMGMSGDYVGPPQKPVAEGLKTINAIIDRIIAKRHALPPEQQPDDVLGRMIASKLEDGQAMSDEEIRGQVIMMIVAGHETSAVGLTYALLELLKNPQEQERIRTQVKTALEGKPLQGRDHVKMLSAQQAFREALRMHPPAYTIARESRVDTKIGDADIKKGDLITINVKDMQRSEDLWPEANLFKPERFEKSKNPAAYMPFGRGAHMCIGMSLSVTEGGLVLSDIFNRVNLEMVNEPKGEQFAFTMRPVGRLEMNVTPRPEAG
jgi:cytochrome P450